MSTTVHRVDGAVRVRPDAILPQHPAYDEARLAWNLAVDQRPAAIVVARTVADVVGAVALAAERDLRVAAQGTGHLAGALPDLDQAILVKTAIGGVEVDPVARVARVGAGAVWRDVVEAVHPYGLAALSGSSHDVGVLGYTLGGGVELARPREGPVGQPRACDRAGHGRRRACCASTPSTSRSCSGRCAAAAATSASSRASSWSCSRSRRSLPA